jgi:hypothetical protein
MPKGNGLHNLVAMEAARNRLRGGESHDATVGNLLRRAHRAAP